MKNLRERSELRGKSLDDDCKIAKISTHEYGMEDNRKFCYGLMEMSTEELIDKCITCKAYVDNAEPPTQTN
ncbi:hypothetical protein [Aminipila terrae]|uniref:Uncharacterized protein n=1 Tax=Aminipila terrae TaxID=2697030 RepID=A0A6P1MJR2_9FIRM|nr:hypothetical protein [Aminipila terrae]QHI72884.1 hypothetical protein Ami3637_11125 [Aminipila terrae]